MAEDNILNPADDKPISLAGDDEPISLVDEPEGPSDFSAGGVQTFGVAGGAEAAARKQYKRPLNNNGTGATRCRVFNSKIAIASLEFMEGQINEWLDSEEIEIKDVGHIIGTMEGKRPEPNLLLVVWY